MSATKFTANDGTTVYIKPGNKDVDCMSSLELSRTKYIPQFPSVLAEPAFIGADGLEKVEPVDYIKESFPNRCDDLMIFLKKSTSKVSVHPLKVGVLFCGRQTPGGHNVIAGIYDHLQAMSPKCTLYGFVGGTAGLFDKNAIIITAEMLKLFRNQGGYDIIGRAADRIKDEDFDKVKKTCEALSLDGLILIGGAYTNTDAAHLSEYFSMAQVSTQIISVPADESRDMHSKLIETTLGFDTVARTYSQLIGNLCTDCNSAKKYYYFIRLPGRHSDYTALECSLQTHPNLCLLSEEVRHKHLSLFGIVGIIADLVSQRYQEQHKDYGIILIPEGLIEAIGELRRLIEELNLFMNQGLSPEDTLNKLSPWNLALYQSLPSIIKSQLIITRESRGSIQLSQISTEKLLAELVKKELALRKKHGSFGGSFTPVCFSFGYKARSSLPTNFDCDFGYTLGRGSVALLALGCKGYITNVYNLSSSTDEWKVSGIPLTTLMNKHPDGQQRAVIRPCPLRMNEAPYKLYTSLRDSWILSDDYINPGPVQFQGEGSTLSTECLLLEKNSHFEDVSGIRMQIEHLLNQCKPGCSNSMLFVIQANVKSLLSVIKILEHKQ